jgi:transposase
VFSQGPGRKTDREEAMSIGLAALDAVGVRSVDPEDALVSLRLLCDRREELVAARTQAACRLHRLLAELTPGGMRRELSADKAAAVLARVRPRDPVGKIRRKLAAAQHVTEIRSLDRKIVAVREHIAELVQHNGTSLAGLFGIGPVIAGRILAEVGDISRFPTKDPFATYNGIAPIDVSSATRSVTVCHGRATGGSTTPST